MSTQMSIFDVIEEPVISKFQHMLYGHTLNNVCTTTGKVEQIECIKEFIVGLRFENHENDDVLRVIVSTLNVLKNKSDKQNYQITGFYERDLFVLRDYIKKNFSEERYLFLLNASLKSVRVKV